MVAYYRIVHGYLLRNVSWLHIVDSLWLLTAECFIVAYCRTVHGYLLRNVSWLHIVDSSWLLVIFNVEVDAFGGRGREEDISYCKRNDKVLKCMGQEMNTFLSFC